jgi:phytoene synthase
LGASTQTRRQTLASASQAKTVVMTPLVEAPVTSDTASVDADSGLVRLPEGLLGASRSEDTKAQDMLEETFWRSPDEKFLEKAYKKCEDVTERASKTFHAATSLMRPDARKHVWAIYAWCRRTDDIVDSQFALQHPKMLASLIDKWNNRLTAIWNGRPYDVFDLAMADTVRKYPTLDIKPFEDMVEGMIMDVPGHEKGKQRYQNFEELYVYCYRVAGTVGLMTLPILGMAPGYTQEQATEPALALGIALQLTNILRDVGEDLTRGRVYLPQDELKEYGLTEQDLMAKKVTDKYKKFLKFQIARARSYYKEAERGIPMLAPDARFAVRASLDLYSTILDKLEENGYDNLNKRAYTTAAEKLMILPGSWLESVLKGDAPPAPHVPEAKLYSNSLASSAHNGPVFSNDFSGIAAFAAVAGAVAASAVALRRRRSSGSIEPLPLLG